MQLCNPESLRLNKAWWFLPDPFEFFDIPQSHFPEQLQKLSAIIDQQNGTNMSAMAGAAAQAAGTTGGGSGGQTTAKTATNGLGAVVGGGGNRLATQAAKRAMNVNNPNK